MEPVLTVNQAHGIRVARSVKGLEALPDGEYQLFTAAQLQAARQQGADEQKQKSSDAYEAFNNRIADLEKSNAQLLEALELIEEVSDRAAVAIASAAIKEVKP